MIHSRSYRAVRSSGDRRQLDPVNTIGWVTEETVGLMRRFLVSLLTIALLTQGLGVADSATVAGPLRVSSSNPRYFARPDGEIVYLTGAHTWNNLLDGGLGYPPPVFDFHRYLGGLRVHNHNFVRLWTWEQSRWTNETVEADYWLGPNGPFRRTGPGHALDDRPKYDLTQFNQAYFDRMRTRVRAAAAQGVYVSVMLFNGWSIERCKGGECDNNPWRGHPFNSANNINKINGDADGDGGGAETHTLAVPSITAVQDAYVRKVVATVGDVDNVLYEVSNESPPNSLAWQNHMVEVIRDAERGRPAHPIGITSTYPDGDNQALLDSKADWISPRGPLDQVTISTGRKVIVLDTDHLCGVCGDADWVWRSFFAGVNPILMDPHDGSAFGLGAAGINITDPRWPAARSAMGNARALADWLELTSMVPDPARSSTGHALVSGARDQILVYAPSGGLTVDLTGLTGRYNAAWIDTRTLAVIPANTVSAGARRAFTPPPLMPSVLILTRTT